MNNVIFIIIFIITLIYLVIYASKTRKEIYDQMTPENRAEYDKKIEEDRLKKEEKIFIMVYGNLNQELICPHCQTKGVVYTKQYSKDIVTTGKIGGIFKTNIKTTTKSWVNQRHCTQCKTTWNI